MRLLVFSKDRGCQLDLLIRSIYKNTPFTKIDVIYTYSSEEFKNGYRRLIKKYDDIRFICEDGFRQTVLKTIEKSEELICPLVDDDLFYRKTDLQDREILDCLNNIDDSVFSLRIGTNILVGDNFTNQPIEQPIFQGIMYENKEWGLVWKKLPGHTPFGYTISLDGHIFKKEWLLKRCQEIEFSTPNFLEGNLQKFNDDFTTMISPIQSVLTSIPANRVQEEFTNRTIGEITSEELNQKWLDGEEIDLEEIKKFNVNCTHSNISYKFNQGKS